MATNKVSVWRKSLRVLKKVWLLSAIRRFWRATKYYNWRYSQILRWTFRSREFTNFTYEITEKNKLYMACTISLVTGETLKTVNNYFKEIEEDQKLKEHILTMREKSDEKYYADNKSIFYGRRIGWYALVRITKPKLIVETGVDKGLGSVLLCSALLRNEEEGFEGNYIGTDINPKAGYLLNKPYSKVGQIHYGDSIESLKQLNVKIDLFINDSDHSADYEKMEYEIVKSKLSSHGVIVGDNSHATDKLAQFSVEQERRFYYIHEEPRNHWYPGAGMGISVK